MVGSGSVPMVGINVCTDTHCPQVSYSVLAAKLLYLDSGIVANNPLFIYSFTYIIQVLFTVGSWLPVPLVYQVTGPMVTTVNNTGISCMINKELYATEYQVQGIGI